MPSCAMVTSAPKHIVKHPFEHHPVERFVDDAGKTEYQQRECVSPYAPEQGKVEPMAGLHYF